MKIEFYPEEKLKKEILEIIGKHLDLKKHRVFFFGSRTNGQANKRSDIDIGIEGPEKIPSGIMAKIREEIFNLPTLYQIDVIDFSSTDKDFRKIAGKNIELINNK
jgi:uncharacterized protein